MESVAKQTLVDDAEIARTWLNLTLSGLLDHLRDRVEQAHTAHRTR